MARRLIPFLLLLAACSGNPPLSWPDIEKERDDAPDHAAEYYSMRRAGTDDIPGSHARARLAMRAMAHYSTSTDSFADRGRTPIAQAAGERPFGSWKFLGPGNVGGRTRALVIDPVQPETMFAAGVSGGIWRSRNGGTNWTPVGDDLMNVAVNTLVMHPADRNTLYAGTGEGYFREEVRGTALPLRGNGIFVTRDAGDTWTQLASTANENFHWVNDLVISRHDPSRVYAATRSGVWRSTDAGANWTRVVPVTVTGGCLELASRTDTNGDSIFASCGTFEQATVYRSANAEGSAAWEPVLTDVNMGRTTLAIAPSRQSTIYALSATNEAGPLNQGLHAVWRSDSNGDAGSWSKRMTGNSTEDVLGPHLLTNLITVDNKICGTPGSSEPPLTMGWYTNTIAVDPVDPERVWAGSVDLFRSDDGGRTWGVGSYWWADPDRYKSFVHADQHAIVFHPQYDGTTNKIAYFANDGGVFRTLDATAAVITGTPSVCEENETAMRYEVLNNDYGVTQFYHGMVFPDGQRFMGGTQDNGTILGHIDEGPNRWVRVAGGDGGYVGVDPIDPRYAYAESQNGNFYLSRDGGRRFTPFSAGLADQFLFITPFAVDPNRSRVVWLGGTQMWRMVDGQRWTRNSTVMPAMVSAIAVAPGNSNHVLAGTRGGHIARTNAATTSGTGTEWASVQPRAGFVASITFDPSDANVVYATYAGFGGGAHVWKSTDGGTVWTTLDGTGTGALPDIPVHSLAVDPTRRERLYLGTDLGVFVSLDGGLTWAVENSGFAAVVTEAVFIGPGANGPAVYAFTHGRGAWRAELVVGGPRRRGVRK
ncbi:MAG TPA: hypothetical protein VEK57_03560 [Thermoanaerobaculia bacterium]|nr:hypothetical protein [Thermoanaerobaculia bacterium]